MKINKVHILCVGVVILLVVVVMTLSPLSGRQETATVLESDTEITIGTLFALSGPAAAFGEISAEGARDAVEYYKNEINPSADITLIEEDSKTNPKDSVSAATKMVTIDNVDAVITSLSSISASVAPIFEKAGIPVLTDATLPGLTDGYQHIFQNFIPSLNEIAVHINERSDWENVAVVYINDDFGSAWSKKITEDTDANAHVVSLHSFEKTATEFKTGALKVKDKEPDVVVVLGYGPALNHVFADLERSGVSAEIITYGACMLPGVLTDERFNLEDSFSYEYPLIDNKNVNAAMNSVFYATAFENTLLALIAAENSNDISAMLHKNTFEGLYGTVKFDENNVVARELRLTKIIDGTCVPANEITPPSPKAS